ncbi:MAG TPA: winged helix DNA-binding domain-containing protein [Candidatus Limnocylindrales bacterium]|nr:winged helix DNA-binding domain-containing protein [Candidatus Limnocylindrales bacterium]
MKLTIDRVLAWRMRRHFLDRPKGATAASIVRRLCGVQAQVASSAQLAIAVRQAKPKPDEVAKALAAKQIIKTWAMRGTLHLISADDAAAYLSLLAAPRTWEKGSWQRTFATAKQIDTMADAAQQVLAGTVLTREELTDAIVRKTGDPSIEKELRSGWGTVLKPLAWQGYLINGPSDGNRVTFTSPQTWLPGWKGLPESDDAARVVIPAYLGAFGPASSGTFDQWLMRGGSSKAALKRWFTELVDAGELTAVHVDGEPSYARTADLDDIAGSKPFDEVRLLDAFDQYVLGPGTKNTQIIAANRRGQISKTAGWIAPVVIAGGRVAGMWEISGSTLKASLFKESGPVPADGIESEAQRIGAYLGTGLKVSVSKV